MYKFTTALNTIGKELLSELPDRLCTHPASYSMDIRVPSRRYSGSDLKLTIYLQVPMLRVSGIIPLLLLYACTARTGTLFSH